MGKADIGWVVEGMKMGKKFRRRGWNGKGMYIGIYNPHSVSGGMTRPYVYIYTAQGDFIPWLASQADLLAEDWEEVE